MNLLRIKRVLLAMATAVLTGVGLVSVAPAAHAYSYGNVYLVIHNWHCVGGGRVTGIWGAVDDVWVGGDSGDNIVYPRVVLYRTNTFNARALCSRPWWQGGSYWINVTWFQFYPTRTGQAFWW